MARVLDWIVIAALTVGVMLLIELIGLLEPEPEAIAHVWENVTFDCDRPFCDCPRSLDDITAMDPNDECADACFLDRWLDHNELQRRPSSCFDRADREHCFAERWRAELAAQELRTDTMIYSPPVKVRQRQSIEQGHRMQLGTGE